MVKQQFTPTKSWKDVVVPSDFQQTALIITGHYRFSVGMATRFHISYYGLHTMNKHGSFAFMCMKVHVHIPVLCLLALPFSVVFFEGASDASGSSFCPSEHGLLSSHCLTSSFSLFFCTFNFFFNRIKSPVSFWTAVAFVSDLLSGHNFIQVRLWCLLQMSVFVCVCSQIKANGSFVEKKGMCSFKFIFLNRNIWHEFTLWRTQKHTVTT